MRKNCGGLVLPVADVLSLACIGFAYEADGLGYEESSDAIVFECLQHLHLKYFDKLKTTNNTMV